MGRKIETTEEALQNPKALEQPKHTDERFMRSEEKTFYLRQHSMSGGFFILFSALMRNIKTVLGVDTRFESLIKSQTLKFS
ncbi:MULTISPECIES: hypothetical protein [unclassified Legionella]|uniref:hypothetical protein n=1 Tax=unclassified Legionella TaxID=2622702 RepID=UPI0010545C78|nr:MULTISPECIES: hypothetical protein [unclassified Legionella]MDI9817624.1 hypothetical protein [Legionella sp. PL877]